MKSIRFLLLGIVVVFTLGLTACDNGGTTDSNPRLRSIYLVTEADRPNFGGNFRNNRTSFSVSEGSQGVGFLVHGSNSSSYNIEKLCVTFKKGGSILHEEEIPMGFDYRSFWQTSMGYYITQIANDYSFEAYVVDTAGNRSNTLSKNFAIIAD